MHQVGWLKWIGLPVAEDTVPYSKEIQSPSFLRACLCQHIFLGDTRVAEAAAAITPHYKIPCFVFYECFEQKSAKSVNVATKLKLPGSAVLCTQWKNRSI